MSSYSNNPLSGEFDFKSILEVIKQYRRSIAIVSVIVLLSVISYLLLATGMFQASLTLQIQQTKSVLPVQANSDVMMTALDVQGGQNLEDELAIIQSYSTITKALQSLDIGIRYYTVGSFKSVELYNHSPFSVRAESIMEELIDVPITLKVIDTNQYELSFEPSLKEEFFGYLKSILGGAKERNEYQFLKELKHFKKVYSFNTPVDTPYFHLTVIPQGKFQSKKYRFKIAPSEYLASQVQERLSIVLSGEKSNVVMMSYEDNIPERAQLILDALAQAYIAQSVENKVSVAKKTLMFIDKQLDAINNALKKSSSALQDYKSVHMIVDPREQGIVTSKEITLMQSQRNELEMQANVLRTLLNRVLQNKDSVGIDMGLVNQISPTILSLTEKLQAADALYTSLSVDYTDQHPAVIKASQQITKLRNNLRATIESSLMSLNERKITLDRFIEKNQNALQSVPKAEQDLSELNNKFLVNQKVYEYLLQKRAETAIVQSSTASSVRIIDPAMSGDKPIRPKKMLLLIIGIVAGLLLGVIQAFIRHAIANTIENIGDVQRKTDLNLLGVLPIFHERKSLYEEALRVILTRLQFGSQIKPKIITFTSSVHGEGRTTTALEFAKIVAKTGKKAIIVDVNIRSGTLLRTLNIDISVGIAEYIRNESTLQQIVNKVITNLDVIGYGKIEDTQSYELLTSDRFEALLNELKQIYDYVILLSPSMGVVADALVLMRMSDFNIVIYRAGYSKKSYLEVTNRFVEEYNMEEKTGILLNGLELSKIRPWRKK